MQKIKMYKHTIRCEEYLDSKRCFRSYHQTGWSSVEHYIPKNGIVVRVEDKIIYVCNDEQGVALVAYTDEAMYPVDHDD